MEHPSLDPSLHAASEATLYRPAALERRAALPPLDEPAIASRPPATYLMLTSLASALVLLGIVLWTVPLPAVSSWPAVMTCRAGGAASCQVSAPVPGRVWQARDRSRPITFADGASIVQLEPVCAHGVVDHFITAGQWESGSGTGRVLFVIQRRPLFAMPAVRQDESGAAQCHGDAAQTTRN
jgi:hypothetical protein